MTNAHSHTPRARLTPTNAYANMSDNRLPMRIRDPQPPTTRLLYITSHRRYLPRNFRWIFWGYLPSLPKWSHPGSPLRRCLGLYILWYNGVQEAKMWQGEVCKKCHRRNVVGFHVTDEVWEKVAGGSWNVLCPTCFDELAEWVQVPYQFTGVWPVSWSDWGD